jgi:hypothetical protein
MKIEVITSFSEAYYNTIGKDCVRTWLKYWPSDLSLTCYVEEFSLPETDRINQISFDQFPKSYRDFQSSKKVGGQERKFAKKSFSFIYSMMNSTADRIIWLDADVLTKKTLPLTRLKDFLPAKVLSTHMGVTYLTDKAGNAGRWFVPETGFFAINTKHEKFIEFREKYTRAFETINFEGLRRRYDNDVYGSVFESTGADGLDLCATLTKPYKTPLKHTAMGEFLHHYKAKGNKAGYQAKKNEIY